MAGKTKIILDVDTGSDDAVAIICAALSPQIELAALCSVAGNRPLANTTENSARVLKLLGRSDIPLYRGVAGPMAAHLTPQRRNFTADKSFKAPVSMHEEYLNLPAADVAPQAQNAVQFYLDTFKTPQPITVVAVGPLTNLALALLIEPGIAKNMQGIVIMGGGHLVYNTSYAAEFNIWYDPEAAAIVLASGAQITLVTLDATTSAPLSRTDAARYKAIGSPAAAFVAEMIEKRCDAPGPVGGKPLNNIAVHDALCIAYLLDESVITDVRHMNVEVDTSGGFADGQTICDPRRMSDRPKNANVALAADGKKFGDIIYGILTGAL